ncbi:MAG: glycosyltransferase [Verrucomicrobiales bacterium]
MSSLTRLYFHCKPFIPRRFRLQARHHWAKRILKSSGDIWPINKAAAKAPPDWPGWPDGKQFAFVLTHDVESQAGLDRVRHVAELEMELGFRSSFNFIPEGDYSVPKELREWLVDNGFEVGVHDLHHDGHLYQSRSGFKKHAARINHYLEEWGAVGFRSGFMLRELDWLHDLNILYDASTFDTDPFEPQPDGAGTIFPYKIRNRVHDRSYVEMPYTLPQDSSLFLVLQLKSPEIWFDKLAWIRKHKGMALLNVHPDYINFGNAKHPTRYDSEIYRRFLSTVKSQYGGEFTESMLPKTIAAWYKAGQCSPASSSVSVISSLPVSAPISVSAPIAVAAPAAVASSPLMATHLPATALQGKRVGVVVLSDYSNDPRPRRASEALQEAGLEVEVICIKGSASQTSEETINGVHIRRIPMLHKRGGVLAYGIHYFGFLAIASSLLALRRISRNYHVIHVHNMPDFLVFSALIPRLFGAKVVLDIHDPMPELMRTIFGLKEKSLAVLAFKWMEKISFAFAHSLITVNHTCRQMFSSRSCPVEKVSVIMNSPDEKMFALREPTSHAVGKKPFVIMYHGSLVERNGLGLALEAMSHVIKRIPEAELRIYGGRTSFLESRLRDAEARGLAHCIRYEGPRKIEEIVTAIDECDVGIIPNLRNIFTEINTPTRIFEFLFRGKAVIAPSAPGVLEYFGEQDLVCFELGDAAGLARQIEFVFQNPDEVLEITRRGQAVCRAHRWSEESKELIALFDRLLCNTSNRALTESISKASHSTEMGS